MSRNLFLYEDVENKIVKEITESIVNFNEEDDEKDEIEKDYKRKPIKLYIDSNGGCTYDGLGLIGVIEKSKTSIHTIVTGKAMSMSLLLAVSGHERYCNRFSTYMYHQASGGARGDVNFMEQNMEEFKRIMNMYDDYLLSKTNLTKEMISKVKEKREWWYMGANEAVDLGLVDIIL